MPRLLLINPANSHKGLGNTKKTAWPPLNLPYLAAATPDDYDIQVLDENIEPFEFQKADIVGITAYTATVSRAYQIASMYRRQGIPTVMGGIHVSMLPGEALKHCDTVVAGEAEDIWPTVLKDFETGNLKKQYQGSWTNLKNLPLPRRDILKNRFYQWGSIQTSRGCPMNCSFCSVTAFNGGRFRRRPLDAVIDELKQIPQKRILITDDNLLGYGKNDIEWAHKFFERILNDNIKKVFFAQTSIQLGEYPDLARIAAKAGLKIVLVGIESINIDNLKSFQKHVNLKHFHHSGNQKLINKIRSAGIALLGAFILGGDADDISVYDATLNFIKSTHIDILQVTKPTPLPGTQLWKSLQKENRIIIRDFPKGWEEFRLTKLVFKPIKQSIEEVYQGFTYLRNIYYSFWETLKRTFFTLITTKSLAATVISYYFNSSYRKAFRSSEHYHQYKQSVLKKTFSRLN